MPAAQQVWVWTTWIHAAYLCESTPAEQPWWKVPGFGSNSTIWENLLWSTWLSPEIWKVGKKCLKIICYLWTLVKKLHLMGCLYLVSEIKSLMIILNKNHKNTFASLSSSCSKKGVAVVSRMGQVHNRQSFTDMRETAKEPFTHTDAIKHLFIHANMNRVQLLTYNCQVHQ